MAISYQTDGVKMPAIKKRETTAWIKAVAATYNKKVGEIAYIFCSDEKILEVNKEYLQHDYYTDIITFDYDEGDIISGDLFISLDTVRTNSEQFDTEYKIFQQIGSTSIFYKTDHEISEMLPKLRMNMNSAINIAQLNKYADEYVRWSDIIQEENKDVLEEQNSLYQVLEEQYHIQITTTSLKLKAVSAYGNISRFIDVK